MEDEFEQVDAVAALLIENPGEGEKLLRTLMAEAAKQRCKTEFGKKVASRKAALILEARMAKTEAEGRKNVLYDGPNKSNDFIEEIGAAVGERRLAFNFGGNPCVLERSQSALLKVKARGPDGKVLLDEDGGAIVIPSTVIAAVPVSSHHAHKVGLDACAFYQKNESKVEEIALPHGLSSRMAISWSNILPPLNGFANHPLWHDGGILNGEGYHEDTHIWLETGDVDIDTFDSADEAVAFLRDEWLVDFPFATPEDLAAAMMMPATLLMSRTTLFGEAGPPMFLATAPSAGTGKTLLGLCAGVAVTGRIPGTSDFPETEEEFAKVIGTSILEGHSMLFFDNLRSGSYLGSKHRSLARMITSPVLTGRILGRTKDYEGPGTMTVVGTGNNVVLDGDMARRTIGIRLVAPRDVNLAHRDFTHPDIVRWTIDNRGKILGALEKVLQVKVRRKPIGSFPAWSRNVAHPILKALKVDVADFFAPWVEAAEEDAKGYQARDRALDLLVAISELKHDGVVQLFEGNWFTAAEIVSALHDEGRNAVLVRMVKEGTETMDARALAFQLKRMADSRYEGGGLTLTVQTSRMDLGERTKWEKRPVFRVGRSGKAEPDDYEKFASMMRAKRDDDAG